MIKVEIKSNKFREIARRVADNAQTMAELAADQIIAIEEQLVPVDTGDLYLSIRKEPKGHAEFYVIAGKIDEDIDYAPFVEYGTINSAAQPFVTPAAEQTRPELIDMVARDILE